MKRGGGWAVPGLVSIVYPYSLPILPGQVNIVPPTETRTIHLENASALIESKFIVKLQNYNPRSL